MLITPEGEMKGTDIRIQLHQVTEKWPRVEIWQKWWYKMNDHHLKNKKPADLLCSNANRE